MLSVSFSISEKEGVLFSIYNKEDKAPPLFQNHFNKNEPLCWENFNQDTFNTLYQITKRKGNEPKDKALNVFVDHFSNGYGNVDLIYLKHPTEFKKLQKAIEFNFIFKTNKPLSKFIHSYTLLFIEDGRVAFSMIETSQGKSVSKLADFNTLKEFTFTLAPVTKEKFLDEPITEGKHSKSKGRKTLFLAKRPRQIGKTKRIPSVENEQDGQTNEK